MRRILFGLAAGVLGVVGLAGTADAHDRHDGRRAEVRYYYREHGHRFSGGYYYVGRDHPHWERRVWDDRYHRWHYWEPELRVWYYFDPGYGRYYPITYCP